jgi:hypothetical protein
VKYAVQRPGMRGMWGMWGGRSDALAQKNFAMPVNTFTSVRMYKALYYLQKNTASGTKVR